jgi:hypothetical protein
MTKVDEAPITLFLHCKEVYDKMLSQAKGVEVFDGEEESPQASGTMIVYEGFLTALITQEMHLSVPYYTSVTKALKNMGCIKQLRRGGGTSPSQWELRKEPTEKEFNEQVESKVPKPDKYTMQQEQINALNGRVLKLEHALEKFLESESV